MSCQSAPSKREEKSKILRCLQNKNSKKSSHVGTCSGDNCPREKFPHFRQVSSDFLLSLQNRKYRDIS
ncbi:unnamed protein product [Staurois parvus]|uniref:Uncharacterized protein n=1 Tax=Staurois parvus TaxID=386267 RepID=A0ABN9GL98_9NEOB|nr:unnamed protein product [Staurois parvus]